MAYPSRAEIPRNYVPSPAAPVAMQGNPLRGTGGLVVGSASGLGSMGGGAGPGGGGLYPRVAHPVGSAPHPNPPSHSAGHGPSLVPSGEIPIRVYVKPELLISPMALGPIPEIPPPRNSVRFFFDFERDFLAQMEREAAATAAASAGASRGPGSATAGAGAQGPFGATHAGRGGPGAGASGNPPSGGAAQDPMVAELQLQLELERAGFGDGSAALLDGTLPQNGIMYSTERQQQQQQQQQQPQQPQGSVLDPAAAEYIAMGYSSDAVHLALAIHNGTTQTKVIDFCAAFTQLSEMGFAPEVIAGALSLYDNDRDRALMHLMS